MTWWNRSRFYEIYVRSFQDANDDGIGDLNGIRQRLPYLQDLGVDAIWITPFYPTAHVDFGYDVIDHEAVDPVFGNLDDFDRLLADAHARSIRVVIDIVLNHTSDRHAWFEESRRSREGPRRNWYIWRDGRGGGPPNNWESAFGGSAWTFDTHTRQWYYHCFYPQQPDLNWRHPAVEHRMMEVLQFWLDRGVDGFRLDAVNTLFEDVELRDNPRLPLPEVTLTGVDTQHLIYTRGLPELHDTLRRIRRFVERRRADALLISEAYVASAEELASFYGADDDEMHLPFNFLLTQTAGRDAAAIRRIVDAVERACEGRMPSLVLSNHDIDRACDRFAGGAALEAVAKLLATLLLTLRGVPFVYYGEEIAMRTVPPGSIAEVRDPVGRRFWPRYKGRDGARRPMQWDQSPGAGFTRGTPWLDVSPDRERHTVARQSGDPGSVLHFYKALLALRRGNEALTAGDQRFISAHPNVLAYARLQGDERAIVVLNLGDESCEAKLGIDDRLVAGTWRLALGTHRRTGEPIDLPALGLSPLETLVLVAEPSA